MHALEELKKKKKNELIGKLFEDFAVHNTKYVLNRKAFMTFSNTQAIIGSSPEYIDFNMLLNFVLETKI